MNIHPHTVGTFGINSFTVPELIWPNIANRAKWYISGNIGTESLVHIKQYKGNWADKIVAIKLDTD